MLYIVGIGPGAVDYILPKAVEVLSKCTRIIGFSRAINSIKNIDLIKDSNFITVSTLKETIEKINEFNNKDIAIIASGDPMFYSISGYIKKNYLNKVTIIPGISSFQYLSCKLGIVWNNAFTGSLHGRDNEFIKIINNYDVSFWLTDKKNNPSFLAANLVDNNINCNLIVGENLSYDDEKIVFGTSEEIKDMNFSDLSVLIVQKNKS